MGKKPGRKSPHVKPPAEGGEARPTPQSPSLSLPHSESPGSIEFLRDAVLVLDSATLDIIACNSAAKEMYGYSRDELLAMNILALSPLKERDLARTKLLRNVQGKKEFQHLKHDGMPIVVEFDNVPLSYGGRAAYLCLIHDISSRSQLIRALLESDASHREIIENASDIIYTHDLQGNFTSANRAATLVLGYSREECLHLNIKDIVVAEDLARAQKAVMAKTPQNPSAGPYNLTVVTKSGVRKMVEVSTRLVFRDGAVAGVQGIA